MKMGGVGLFGDRRGKRYVVLVVLFAAFWMLSVGEGKEDVAGLAKECSANFEKVMSCMSFATGKAAAPTKECCESVTEIRADSPKCMCFVIQETKNGSEQIKSLGIQADKLLQLPADCHLKNSSVSDCPKLLGLAPNSPEAALFSNVSTTSPSAPATTAASKATPTAAKADTASGSNELRPQFPATGVVVLVLALQAVLGIVNFQKS